MRDVELPVRPGDIIGGKYRVEGLLGQGGMAVVVSARHEALDELVAIKILLPHRAENPDVRERFAREARAAVKIKSEHVARVSDVGALKDGTPYIVMEYLEGEDLASVLARRERLPATEAVLYVLQVCDALREAHALGIIHRDIKPANLFLAKSPGRPPRLKVLDFGISKVERTDRRRTETKEILGSPWYMAPEQMQSSKSADARSDVWSLGVILYELVTGEVPFDGETMTEVIVKVLHDEAPLASAHADLPAALQPIIRRCLAKNPDDRFADIDEFTGALRSLERTSLTDMPVRPTSNRPKPTELARAEDIELLADDAELFDDDDGEVVDEAELLPTPFAPPVSAAPDVRPPPEIVPDMPPSDPGPAHRTPPPRAKEHVNGNGSANGRSSRPPRVTPSRPPAPPHTSRVPRPTSRSPVAAGPAIESTVPTPAVMPPVPPLVSEPTATTTEAPVQTPRVDLSAEAAALGNETPTLPTPMTPVATPALTEEKTIRSSEPPTRRASQPPAALAESVQDTQAIVDERNMPTARPPPRVAPSADTRAERRRYFAIAALAIPVGIWLTIVVSTRERQRPTTPLTSEPVATSPSLSSTSLAAPALSTAPTEAPKQAPTHATGTTAAPTIAVDAAVVAAPRVDPPTPSTPSMPATPSTPAGAATAPAPAAPRADPPQAAAPKAPKASPRETEPVVAKPVPLAGLGLLPGPGPGPAHPSAAKDEDPVAIAFQVARKNQASVRDCWENSSRTTSVVTVQATVDTNGTVTSASAQPTEPGLGQCVEGKVRGWSFPASDAPRTYRVPVRMGRK